MTESRQLLDDLQASTPEVRLGLSRAGVQGVAKAIRISWGGAEKLISAEIDCFVDLDPGQKVGVCQIQLEMAGQATQRGVSALAQAALRYGGLEQIDLRVDGPMLAISPVTPASGPVVLGEELRDLGAAVAVIVIRALGGSVVVNDDTLAVNLPE